MTLSIALDDDAPILPDYLVRNAGRPKKCLEFVFSI